MVTVEVALGVHWLMINKGYDDFISMVSEHRNMSKEAVDKVAQGRVWTGTKALEFGLVDKLGTFDDAIALNAHDYATSNPELGWIENGVIENCHDLNAEKLTCT